MFGELTEYGRYLKKIVLFLVITPLILLGTLSFATQFGRGIDGVVVDEETGQPIANAIVVAAWKGHVGWTHGQDVCYHVEVARSDSAGNFNVAAWTGDFTSQSFPMTGRYTKVVAYKLGYANRKSANSATQKVFLRKFSGSAAEYLSNLGDVFDAHECFNADRDGRLFPLFDEFAIEPGHLCPSNGREALFDPW